MDELIKQVNKIRNFTQYKNSTQEELEKVARKTIAEKEVEKELISLVGEEELPLAKEIFNKYINEYQLETSSDKSTLLDLVYYEILNLRIKKYLTENYKTEDGSVVIHTKTIESLNAQTDQINKLKSLLGMTKKQVEVEHSDVVKIMENLKSRYHTWINSPENRANYTLKTPCCGKMLLIRRRLDKEKDEVLIHPWFVRGGVLFNKHLWKMHHEGKISDDDIMKVLNLQSMDYIEWVKRHYIMELNQKVEEENDTQAVE
ncbi:MAG: hypothetical protein V1901_03715 [Patescibacteria group bacterium]